MKMLEWEGLRVPVAFLVAPLAVPIIMVWYIGPAGSVIAMTVAYVGTTVIGLPLFILFVAYNVTTFIIAPIIGAIAGAITMWLLSWGLGPLMPPELLKLGAPSGAAVGALLWLIARPDRRTQGTM